jgi:Uma2 family endonuclease
MIMTTVERPLRPGAAEPKASAAPPLENGDHLTRSEFERRYAAMPHLKKAELIEGRVYVGSPVRLRSHGQPHGIAVTWLNVYAAATPGTLVADNATVRLDRDNEPQPDAFLMILPECGGQALLDVDDYVSGAPELVVEVTASTVGYDLHEKLNAYRRNGVREYAVVRTLDGEVDWFVLTEERYTPQTPGDDGVLRSTVFPGLWLEAEALFADTARMLSVLQQGLVSPEHAEFVASLAAKSAT